MKEAHTRAPENAICQMWLRLKIRINIKEAASAGEGWDKDEGHPNSAYGSNKIVTEIRLDRIDSVKTSVWV